MRALAALLLAARAAVAGPPTAMVGGDAIALDAVDARCGSACAEIVAEVRTRKAAMVETLVGEALLAGAQPVVAPPVPDTAVDAYLTEHAADFHGPTDRDRAAVRSFLEREAGRAAERARIAAERARRPPRILVAPGDPALVDDARPDRVLAEAGGRRIRDRDVEGRLALPLYRLRGMLALERRRQLDEMVVERLWMREAAARQVDVAALRMEIRARAAPVTEADIDRYYAEEVHSRNPGVEKRPDRIRPLLAFRAAQAAEDAFIAGLRARERVRVTLASPRPPRLTLSPGRGGWRGPRTARTRVIFLTGYRDPVSRAMWPVVEMLGRDGGTAIAVRPLLPRWDPEASAVASAVRCAAEQGRPWAVHDAAARAPALPDGAELERMATAAGVAPVPFRACLARPDTLAAVTAESAEAERLGLDEPPATLVNGVVLGGMQDLAALRAAAKAH